ncbi:MAG TPA: hypothetical protein VHX36_02745 [Candidatus Acidoferrales bacterium]|jgi:hypothetical protein|nr:hypothetical protein [Candidatus Acidoferrales bacterium]
MNKPKKARRKMKTQVQHSFARVLGQRPRVRRVNCQLLEGTGIFLETFGPAEMANRSKSALVYWNFVRDDGQKHFTLFLRVRPKAKPDQVAIKLVAGRGIRSFREWVFDRLSAVESGEDSPAFLAPHGGFAVKRVG